MHFSSKGQRCLNFNHRRLPVRIFIISCGLYKKASQISISLRLGFLLSVLNHNMYGLNTQNMICPADIRTGRNPYATISANEGGTIMHVLLVNGSPHKTGCTYTALSEVVKALNRRESRQKFSTLGTPLFRAVLPVMPAESWGAVFLTTTAPTR